MDQHTADVISDAAKASPPATVSLATVFGYPVSDVVLWATLLYTVLLIVHKLLQMFEDFQGKNGRK